MDVAFIDAHMHLWDHRRLLYPWLLPPFGDGGPTGNVAAIAGNYLAEDYRRDLAGWNLAGAVHVQAGADAADALAETEWLHAVARDHGLPTALVAFADLASPDLDASLEAQAAFPLVRGIRHIANWHADPDKTYAAADPIDNSAWCEGFGRLAHHGLAFDFQLYPSQMAAAARLAARFDPVPVIINHAGMPVDRDAEGLAEWRRGMRLLAELDHVSVKLSGFGIVDHGWTVDSIRPLVLETIEIFGTDRCMVASDSPTDKLFAPIERVMSAFAEILAGFSPDERAALFAGTAGRIYRPVRMPE